MTETLSGAAQPHFAFISHSNHLMWILGALTIIALLLFCGSYFARCARRGVCPFPHGKRRKQVTAGDVPTSARLVEAATPSQQSTPLRRDDPLRSVLLNELQGNIISGHGRDHAVHLFIRFSADAASARAWLRQFAETYVVSAAVQQEKSRAFRRLKTDGGIFGHAAISAAGYAALGFAPQARPKPSNLQRRLEQHGYSDVFAAGMKARQRYLLDPEVSDWDTGFQGDIHALVILAGDSEGSVNEAVDAIACSLSATADGATRAPIGSVVARENGMGLTRQLDLADPSTKVHVEHFGYVDGRSQPLFLEEQLDAERKAGGTSTWDPSAPLSLALVADPLGKTDSSFGSFLVFRKLEQNVRGWNRAIDALAGELKVQPELAGAMTMGRFKDGTPVIAQGTPGRTDVPNDFDFQGDTQGRRCPFHAHIRKTNPRGEAIGAGDSSVESERGHRIVRRGIPYGGPLTTSDVPEEQPEGGVGLLFFCYQSDIWEQFEFIQRRWCNNPFFLQPQKSKDKSHALTGLDPVVGQTHPQSRGAAHGPTHWPAGWGKEAVKVETEVSHFVTMKGGEYFFSPSMSFLLSL